MRIRAALFDMDGTIWNSPVDWLEVRRAIGLPRDGRPILQHLAELPSKERARGVRILHRYEAYGVKNGTLIPGTCELLRFLQDSQVKCALVSNNSRRSVEGVLARHDLPFDLVISRDDGAFKPDPEPFLTALQQLNVSPEEALVIGDAHLDLLAAHRAGIKEIILVATKEWMRPLLPSDIYFHRADNLFEVQAIVTSLLHPGVNS